MSQRRRLVNQINVVPYIDVMLVLLVIFMVAANGMGIYPVKRPDYEVAFVLLEEPPLAVKMPPWAIRLVLSQKALDRAAADADTWAEERLEEMPEL